MLGRLISIALLFSLELLAITVYLDTGDLPQQGGLIGLIGKWGPTALRAVVALAALFLTFGVITAGTAFRRVSAELEGASISWALLAAHFCTLSAFGALSGLVFGHTPTTWLGDLVAVVWLAAGVLAITLAAVAFVPLTLWLQLLSNTRGVLVLASFGGIIAGSLGDPGGWFSTRVLGLTFDLVSVFLHPFVSDLTVNPATQTIASHSFYVIINRSCSGLEGAGLMLTFTGAWIWIFRRECRFPQALLLVPISIFLVWLMNAARIAALFLIGNGGAPGVAMGGFHSQAGWITFNALALGFTLALHRVPGLTTSPSPTRPVEDQAAENPSAWYLAPFLTILAVAMVTRAVTEGFEWLYPIRFAAAALVLWHYRRKYTKLDWRIGWIAPLAGGIAFALWLALDSMKISPSPSAIGAGLASLQSSARSAWIIARILAATATVPIAEELAFRGFLLRRLISPNFQEVKKCSFTFLSVLVSSVAFGALHGDRWLAGTGVGVLYALAYRHRGSMGDAVAAHAITNAFLVLWVLLKGNWQLL